MRSPIQHLPLSLVLSLSAFSSVCLSYTWPSPQYDALEGLLYEGRRVDGTSLATLVHPCRKRTVTLASIPAEWLRFAFHDMATYNINDGTGGLDGSLVYELGRSQNFGLGFNQTAEDYATFPNKMVSRADVIALGAVHAVASCGGPIIPFRGGRVDTYSAGGFGTPEPQQDLATLTNTFKQLGFSPSEMIKLVACGHTMGGVRSTNFPNLVAPGPNADVPNIVDFDTTKQFDNKVVTEYLDGSTQNVLVVAANQTMASDRRVFESDGNSTVRSLTSGDTFQTECKSILDRMLNVVPKGVTLTDEITLLPAKVKGTQLTLEKNKLVFKSSLRLTQLINTKPNDNRTVTMFWCDKYGANKNCAGTGTRSSTPVAKLADDPNISPVTLRLGYYFMNYDFVVPIDPAQSISKFWFQVDEKDGSKPTVYNNGGSNYVVEQDQVFFVPTLSTVDVISNGSYTKVYTNRVGESFYRSYNLVVGVRNDLTPSRVYVDGFDIAVAGYAYAVNVTVDLALNSSMTPVEGYKFYTGKLQDSGLQLTIDVHAESGSTKYTQGFMSTTLLDNTPYVAPGAIATSKTTSGARSAGRDSWAPLLLSISMSAVSYWFFG